MATNGYATYRAVLVLYIGLAGSVGPAFADDWPHWTGPLGRNAATEMHVPTSFDRKTGENIKWMAPLGDVAFGAPTVADGRVFVGTNMSAMRDDPRFRPLKGGVLVCLDEATGERIWSLVAPERTEGFPERTHMIHQRWGLCSSPTVDQERVYVVTNGNDLLCLDVKGLQNGNDGTFQEEATFMAGEGNTPVALTDHDADILWRYDIPTELAVAPHDVASSSVLVWENALYLATSNGIGERSPVFALNRDAPGFIAIDKHQGTLLAREEVGLSQNLFHAQWGSATSAALGERTLIVLGGNDGFCHAFAPVSTTPSPGEAGNLESVWRFDANPPHYRDYPNGKPIYYYQGDERVYERKQKDGEGVEGFNAGDGSFVGPNEILATPVFYDNKVYVVTGRDPLHGLGKGVLSCIDARGEGDISASGLVWRFERMGRALSTVAIADGLVYAADLQGRIYCLDAGMGVLYWQHDTGHEIWGNPLVADGKVYLNTTQSFWIFAAGRKKEILFEQRGGSECGPIAANGVVYAFIRGALYAITKKEIEDGTRPLAATTTLNQE